MSNVPEYNADSTKKRLRMANRAGDSCTEVGSEDPRCKIKPDLMDPGKNILSYLVAQMPILDYQLSLSQARLHLIL